LRVAYRLVGEHVVVMTELKADTNSRSRGVAALGSEIGRRPSVVDAPEELGLGLKRRKTDIEILVIDHVARITRYR